MDEPLNTVALRTHLEIQIGELSKAMVQYYVWLKEELERVEKQMCRSQSLLEEKQKERLNNLRESIEKANGLLKEKLEEMNRLREQVTSERSNQATKSELQMQFKEINALIESRIREREQQMNLTNARIDSLKEILESRETVQKERERSQDLLLKGREQKLIQQIAIVGLILTALTLWLNFYH